jgi:hypothetical protein
VLALLLPSMAALAGNTTSPSINAKSTKLRASQHSSVIVSSSTGKAKMARDTLLKQRTGILGTSTRRSATTVTSKLRPPARTIVTKTLTSK